MNSDSIPTNCVQYYRNATDCYKLDIKALEPKYHKRIYERIEEDGQFINLDFGDTPEKVTGQYLDVYEGFKSEILYPAKFNKNSNLGTIYFRRIDMIRSDKKEAEGKFPNIRTELCSSKIIRWYRMLDIFGQRRK